jgi:DNA-binding MarR family transcriptional regulator
LSAPAPLGDDAALDAFFAARGVDMGAHRAVFEAIRAASAMVSVMEELALRPLGLSHAGYRVLCELWIKGPLEPRNLAGFMLVSRPSIVGTIDTLQANGLVVRSRGIRDRRLVMVELTPSGRDVIERADAAWHAAQVQITEGMTDEERELLATLARRLTRKTIALSRRD